MVNKIFRTSSPAPYRRSFLSDHTCGDGSYARTVYAYGFKQYMNKIQLSIHSAMKTLGSGMLPKVPNLLYFVTFVFALPFIYPAAPGVMRQLQRACPGRVYA